MIENPSSRVGMISQKRAEIHFMSHGFSVCWPAVDNGFDLLIHRDDASFFKPIRVQVKSLRPSGCLALSGAGVNGNTNARVRREANFVAANTPRHYDVLAVVGDEYMWLIPEAETRGVTSIRLVSKGTGKRKHTMKYEKFKEARLDG